MIRDIYIAARNRGSEEGYTEPPDRELNLSVIGDDVHLRVITLDDAGTRTSTAGEDIVVPAQSLLLALQAAINDRKAAT